MTTVYFSNGTQAEVENVRGQDPRTFVIPSASYSAFADAMTNGATIQFHEGGPAYLLAQMRGAEGKAILQVTRARR